MRLLLTCLLCCTLHAQTADRSATLPTPATAAPAAYSGTYTVVNGELIVAPGLRIPNGTVPWALDTIGGRQVLVPVHHTALSQDGATATLAVGAPLTPLHSTSPVFFIHAGDRTENSGDAARGTPTGWALVSIKADGTSRTVERVKFADVSAATVCADSVICTQAEALPGGWLRLTPKVALAPGQYALLPVPRSATSLSPLLYDFVIGDGGAVPKDVVAPGQNLDTSPERKVHHPH